MLEPQSDEERKALRLAKVMWDSECIDEHDVRLCMSVLAEARAIVREEQGFFASQCELELTQVRSEVSYVGDALIAGDAAAETGLAGFDAIDLQNHRLNLAKRWLLLLSRERELMAKSEPEGGGRG